MKSTYRYPLLLTAIMTLILAGCNNGEEQQAEGEKSGKSVEIIQKGDNGKPQELIMKLDDDQKTTIKYGAVDNLAGFGVPIYPNIEKVEGGVSITGAKNGEKEGMQTAILFTSDPYDKVVAFYKKQLQDKNPQVMEMNMPDGQMTMFMLEGENASRSINLTKNDEKHGTNIQLIKTAK